VFRCGRCCVDGLDIVRCKGGVIYNMDVKDSERENIWFGVVDFVC
jgi:hypothetical protein